MKRTRRAVLVGTDTARLLALADELETRGLEVALYRESERGLAACESGEYDVLVAIGRLAPRDGVPMQRVAVPLVLLDAPDAPDLPLRPIGPRTALEASVPPAAAAERVLALLARAPESPATALPPTSEAAARPAPAPPASGAAPPPSRPPVEPAPSPGTPPAPSPGQGAETYRGPDQAAEQAPSPQAWGAEGAVSPEDRAAERAVTAPGRGADEAVAAQDPGGVRAASPGDRRAEAAIPAKDREAEQPVTPFPDREGGRGGRLAPDGADIAPPESGRWLTAPNLLRLLAGLALGLALGFLTLAYCGVPAGMGR